MRERGWEVMWGCGGGGDSAVQPQSMGGVGGGEEGHTQEHTQERTSECCTYPLATYPLKSARMLGLGFQKVCPEMVSKNGKFWYVSLCELQAVQKRHFSSLGFLNVLV